LANTYPRDEGVRITAHLARWPVEERQRFQIPIPAILQKEIPQDQRQAPKSTRFPTLSHRINVLTPISYPYVTWASLEVERAMGIEPTWNVLPGLENKRFGANADAKCD
jgi:hypothetical protein